MIYLLIIIWRIVLLFYYLVIDSFYFLVFFKARFFKKVYIKNILYHSEEGVAQYTWFAPTRKITKVKTEYKNIFYYLLRPVKI